MLRNSSSAHCLAEGAKMEPVTRQSSIASGSWRGTCSNFGSHDTLGASKSTLNHIDAAVQVDTGESFADDTSKMGKKRDDIAKIRKGTPLYSREDIREQYCINSKEIEVLERAKNRSLFGCLSAHRTSPCKKKTSFLPSCVKRRASDDNQPVLHYMPQHPSQSSFTASKSSTLPPLHPTAPIVPNKPRPSTIVGLDASLDDSLVRRRPKSFCVSDPRRFGVGASTPPMTGMGLNIESRLPEGGYSSIMSLPKGSSLPVHHTTSPSVTGTNVLDQNGYPVPPSYPFSYGGRLAYTQPNTPDLSALMRRKHMQSPELLLDDRRQKHVSFDSSSPKHQHPGEYPNSNYSVPNLAYAGDTQQCQQHHHHHSHERLLDGRKSPESSYRMDPFALSPSLARAILIEKLKKASMKSQATQTDVLRRSPPINPSRSVDKVSMHSRESQAQFSDEELYKARRLIKSYSEVDNSHDKYETEVYEIDTPLQLAERNVNRSDSSLSSSPVIAPPPPSSVHNVPNMPFKSCSFDCNQARTAVPNGCYVKGKKKQLLKALSEGAILLDRHRALRFSTGFVDVDLDERPTEEVSVERVLVHHGVDLSSPTEPLAGGRPRGIPTPLMEPEEEPIPPLSARSNMSYDLPSFQPPNSSDTNRSIPPSDIDMDLMEDFDAEEEAKSSKSEIVLPPAKIPFMVTLPSQKSFDSTTSLPDQSSELGSLSQVTVLHRGASPNSSAGGNHIPSDSELDSTSPRPPVPKSGSALLSLHTQASTPLSDARSDIDATISKDEKEIMLEFPPWVGDEVIPAPTPFAQPPSPSVSSAIVTRNAPNDKDAAAAEVRKSNLADAILKAHRARLTIAGLKNHPESLSETLTSPESESSESRFTEHETSKSSEPTSRTSPTPTAFVTVLSTKASEVSGHSGKSMKSRVRELVSESSEDFVTAVSEANNNSSRRTYNTFESTSSFVTAFEPTISEGSRYSTLRTDFSSEEVQFASPLLDDIAETAVNEPGRVGPELKESQSQSIEETEESSSSGSYSLDGQNATADVTPTVEDLRLSVELENAKPEPVPIVTPTQESKKLKRKLKSRSDTTDLRSLLRDMPLSTDDEIVAGITTGGLSRSDTRHRREKFAEKTRTIDEDVSPIDLSTTRAEDTGAAEFRDRLTEEERRKLKEALKLQIPSASAPFVSPVRSSALHSSAPHRSSQGATAAAEKYSLSDDEEIHHREASHKNAANPTESTLLATTAEGARKRRNKTIEISMRRPAKVSEATVVCAKSRSRSPPSRRKFKGIDDGAGKVETPLTEIMANKLKSGVCEELTSGMVRSPAMHEGFRVEDWIVERTPVQTPDAPGPGDVPESPVQQHDKFRKHKRNPSEAINPPLSASTTVNKLPSVLSEPDYENIEASAVRATTSIHLTHSPASGAEEDDRSLLENPTTDISGSQLNLLAPTLSRPVLSCESLRSMSPGSDSVFLSESLGDLSKRTSRRSIAPEMEDSTTTLEYVNPPEGFADSPGTLSQSVTEDETAKALGGGGGGKEEQQGSFKNKRKESGRGKRAKSCTLPLTGQDELDPPSAACHAGSSKSLEGDSTWPTHRDGQKPERAVSASEMWYPETKLPALRQITLRAKSEERAREHRLERRFCPRSVESSWESFSSQKNEPPSPSEDEDAGIYDAGYRNGLWMYVGETEELQVWKRIEKPSESDGRQDSKLVRTASNDSTTSERDFRRKYTAITHRMVHRKASVEMFRRLATDTFNQNSQIAEEIRKRLTLRESLESIVQLMLIIWCREHYAIRLITGERDKTVIVKRQSGEFGFRIHGSRPVVVSAIEPGTPAESSGLEVGDIIITINDVNVLDSSHSEVVKIAHAGSDELKLEVTRTCDVFAPGSKDTQDNLTVLSGYLWRQGGFTTRSGNQSEATNTIKPWYRRWFALKQDNTLYYYKNEQMQQPLGAIVLLQYTVSLASDSDRPFTFHLMKSGQCRHVLAAESESSMHRWASAITQFGAAAVQNDLWMETCRKQVELSPNAIPNPDCLGFLMKLGHRLKAWQRRFCLLKDACLFFYADSTAASALGLIHLHGYRVQSGSSSGNRKFAFELLPSEPRMRHFHFYTDSENERKRWIAALEYSIDRWIRLG